MSGFARHDRRRSRGRLLAASVLALFTVVACQRRGIVGVLAAKGVERDAMTTPSTDAADRLDAKIRFDANGSGPISIDDCLPVNAANLDPSVIKQLIEATGDASSMRYLYPYDGTVYPQGIPGPVLMWDGPAADAVYIRVHSSRFDYRGCLKPSGPNRLELPSGIWDVAGASTRGAADPFTLDLKVLSSEMIRGPISEQLVIATGALPGSVYYMSLSPVGGIFRVRAGRPAEAVLNPPSCAGCHSVSENGRRLLAYSSGFGSSFMLSASSPITPQSAVPGAELAGVLIRSEAEAYAPTAAASPMRPSTIRRRARSSTAAASRRARACRRFPRMGSNWRSPTSARARVARSR